MQSTSFVSTSAAAQSAVGRMVIRKKPSSMRGPVELVDARAVIDLDRESLDVELLRRLAQRFARDAAGR